MTDLFIHPKIDEFRGIRQFLWSKFRFYKWTPPHIVIFLWPSSGPHNQLSLGPHTAMTYGPSVDQVWIPDKGHTWAIIGPIQGQLWVINLAETWASYGPCVALVWNPDLVHTRTVSHCGMWAKRKLILWAGAGPEKNCYVGRSWAREQLLCGMEPKHNLK